MPKKTAIAIVMDTSISMRPYIEQSNSVVRRIYDVLEQENMADYVAFAVVAFRSSIDRTPKLEYTTKIVSDFKTATERRDLENALKEVDEANASSHDFNEDSLAGVRAAIEKLSWEGYGSKIIILVSDAGPLPLKDLFKSLDMGASEINELAKKKAISIVTLHIKSPSGKKNHKYAEEQYRNLSRISGRESYYLAIDASTPAKGAQSFASETTKIANSLRGVVQATMGTITLPKPKETKKNVDKGEALAQKLGYAMYLEYLGKKNNNASPSVVSSWVADKDLQKIEQENYVSTVEAAVLLTKNQLNDLASKIKTIVDKASIDFSISSKDFFQSILSAAAISARDPNMSTQGKTLAEIGVLAEFLEGLPYKSHFMGLDGDTWDSLSVGERDALIYGLKSRLALYAEYNNDQDNWESFGQKNPGDWFYRVPLDALP